MGPLTQNGIYAALNMVYFFSQMLEGKEKDLEEANSSLKYQLSVQHDPMTEFRNPG